MQALVFACCLAGAWAREASSVTSLNIVKLAESDSELSTLVAALVAGDLADTLSSPGPFTVFAPSNAAFKSLPPGKLRSLMKPENKKELVDILTYHVLPEEVLSKDLNEANDLKTVEGKLLTVEKLCNITSCLVLVGVGELGAASVIKADNLASNGVVHIIDNVVIPPRHPFPPSPAPKGKTIVQLAESVPELSTFVSAVVAADLADILSAGYEATVFAPTNKAFKALPRGTFDRLMQPENKKELVDVMTFHVVTNEYLSKYLKPFQAITTFEGKPLHVVKGFGKFSVGASLETKDLKNVVRADITANNGLIHIIDGVLLPPKPSAILV